MKRHVWLGLVLLLAIGLFHRTYAESGPKAPNFALKTANGKTVELGKLKGKVVVVNFWATWCGPCKAEIPGFIEVYKDYRSRGVEIVGISLDRDSWDVVKPYIEKAKITYPVVVDAEGKIAEAYGGINAIPTTFIVDKDGNIAKRHVGYMSKDDLKKLLTSVL